MASESLRSAQQGDKLGEVRSMVIGWRLGLNKFLSSTRLFASSGAKQDEESLLASARVLLTTASLLATYIDPPNPALVARALEIILLFYVVHSLVVWILARHRPQWVQPSRWFLHAADLLYFACISAFIQSASGTWYLLYPFWLLILLGAAYRWGLYQTLVTAAAGVALQFLGATVMASGGWQHFNLQPQGFDLKEFTRREAYLFITACVVGYLGEKESELRTKTSVIARLIGKVHSQTSVRETLEVALGTFLAIFDASRAVLVLKEERKQRAFLWEAEPAAGTQASTVQWSELETFQQPRYFFPLPGTSCYAVRRRPERSAQSFDVLALGPHGERIGKATYDFPDYFLEWHSLTSLLVVSFTLGEDPDWSGRLFLFDPRTSGAYEAEMRFLQDLIREMGPAVHTVYRLRRLRSRATAMERARIARELHDGVIQTLSAVHARLEFLRRHRASIDRQTADDLAEFQRWLRREISNVRDLMQQIRSLDLGSRTLLESVADLVDKFRADTGIATELVTESKDIVLPPLVAREVLRIVGEALTNVRKHSGARNVRVRFAFKDLLNLVIEDDGRGFDFSGRLSQAELEAARRGPVAIKERVRSIGGELTLESTPGRGTRLQITWAPNRQEQRV
jgi:signal transduction histidine kinase